MSYSARHRRSGLSRRARKEQTADHAAAAPGTGPGFAAQSLPAQVAEPPKAAKHGRHAS